MTPMQRQAALEKIAAEDTAFTVWKKSYEECVEKFYTYSDGQPEDVQNILCGYAEAGRLMYQRLVNLACEHMHFPDET